MAGEINTITAWKLQVEQLHKEENQCHWCTTLRKEENTIKERVCRIHKRKRIQATFDQI